jgi:hypothetical protein
MRGSVSPRANLGIVQVRARPCSCGPHDVERDLCGSVIPRAGGRFEGSWVPGVGSAGLQPVGCRDGLRVVSVRGGDGVG